MAPRAFQTSKDYQPTDVTQRQGFVKLMPPGSVKSELAKYRILSSHAGVRVSPLALGAMSLGDQWTGFMGTALDGPKAEELLDAFYDAGGNFIDTANLYQDEQSEVIIGEWMKRRNNRDEIVLATKYTMNAVDRINDRFEDHGIAINQVGNSRKNLRISVQRSLKNLQTDYIDLLYIHFWDYSTSVEEAMRSLDDLVKSGKVLYLGISDTPAWIVARANDYAITHGLTPFSIYQGRWSLANRDIERDVIPMLRAYGMSLAGWGVLGGGKFKSAAELQERAKNLRDGSPPTEKELKTVAALEEVAAELGGASLTSVAMAWARQTMFDFFPIIGGSSVERLKENIEALKVHLTEEQVFKLSNAVPFDWGFPYDTFGRDPRDLPGGGAENVQSTTAGRVDFKPRI